MRSLSNSAHARNLAWPSAHTSGFRSASGNLRVGVLANPSGECEPELLVIEAWARDVCADVLDLGTSAEPDSLPADCEIIIALGGDGTILRALQLAMSNNAAV